LPADPDDSLAFMFGVVPLMLSIGAGAEMRQLLGTASSAACGRDAASHLLTPVVLLRH